MKQLDKYSTKGVSEVAMEGRDSPSSLKKHLKVKLISAHNCLL